MTNNLFDTFGGGGVMSGNGVPPAGPSTGNPVIIGQVSASCPANMDDHKPGEALSEPV